MSCWVLSIWLILSHVSVLFSVHCAHAPPPTVDHRVGPVTRCPDWCVRDLVESPIIVHHVSSNMSITIEKAEKKKERKGKKKKKKE